jgi:ankyrin repeat protein
MKRLLLAATLWASVVNFGWAADDLQQNFQKALFEEEANHNLDAAIQGYQSVLKQLEAQRKLAATAIFRLGECYRKLGKTNEATLQFQRVVREFADQAVLTKLSQQNLAVLGFKDPAPAKVEGPPKPGDIDMEAAEIGRLKILIQNSPDLINARSNENSPLQKAVANGQLKVVAFLLQNGVNINEGAGQRTALKTAVDLGNRAMVDLLLSQGADVNARDAGGETALHLATSKGYRAVAERLLEAKADVNAVTKRSGTSNRGDGLTPLHHASIRRDESLAALLLAHKANPNAVDDRDHTPLHWAALNGATKAAQLLLDNGANVNAKDEISRTPLYCAVERGDSAMCDLLLKHGAEVNAPITSQVTVTVQRPALAGESGSPEQTVQVSCNGFTPLHYASLKGHEDIARLLLAKKAEVNAKAVHELEPLNLVVTYGQPGMVRLLLENGADVNWVPSAVSPAPLMMAVKRRSEEMVSIILLHKPDLEQRDQGNTVLHHALSFSLDRIVEMLLANGADPNASAVQPNAWSPLHFAVGLRNRRMVQQLLAHKAEPNPIDSDGKTPLDLAKAQLRQLRPAVSRSPKISSDDPISEIISLLRKAGATEYPQRSSNIMIGRGDRFSNVFSRTTAIESFHTLLEAIGVSYRTLLSQPGPLVSRPIPSATQARSPLDFPDFSRIVIRRMKNGGGEELIKVDLATPLQNGDCSKDVRLQWGDMIEISEREHKLNENWAGLSFEQSEPLRQCLRRKVKVILNAKSGRAESVLMLSLFPDTILGRPDLAEHGGAVRLVTVTSFRLDETLRSLNFLLTSSDQTRVKVKRTDPTTRATAEFTVNLFDPTQNFWLQDGDVVEVPEKE